MDPQIGQFPGYSPTDTARTAGDECGRCHIR
jgi:hypothetical protein